MLSTMFAVDTFPIKRVGKFGVRIDLNNLKPHLAELSKSRQRYQKENPSDISEIVAMAKRSEAARLMKGCSRKGRVN